ncbi:hypothetical protein, partial [Aeromonas jandaei]|uniref:hypothetical protein n=1 Tax=Aeromonas jandaei TaxID=650 RepID=UPI001E45406B
FLSPGALPNLCFFRPGLALVVPWTWPIRGLDRADLAELLCLHRGRLAELLFLPLLGWQQPWMTLSHFFGLLGL